MKLNILIADDEYFIRQRMKKIIPFERLNLHLIGEVEDGLEVLHFLEEHIVDIILLDIKMPKLTGIDVASYVLDHCPLTKIIILSGYNDFEYAQKTLHFGVFDYLLKPVDLPSLEATLENCIKKITDEKERERQIQSFQDSQKRTALANILNHGGSFSSFFESYPIFSKVTHSAFLGLYFYGEAEVFLRDFLEILTKEEILCEYYKEYEYTYTIQLFGRDETNFDKIRTILFDVITQTTAPVFFVEGIPFSVSDPWISYYKSILKLLNQRYFCESSYSKQPEIAPDVLNFTKAISQVRQNLTCHLNAQNIPALTAYMDSLFEEIAQQKNYDFLHLTIIECYIACSISYKQQDFTYNISEFVAFVLDEEYQLSSLKTTVLNYFLTCMNQTENTPSDINFSNRLRDYIGKHYADTDLTVTLLSEVFQLNPSYMGSLFKRVNNISVLQYITKIRMEASKELLQQNTYRISDIAEMVGYSDIFYYSKRFKKMYGHSPKEYLSKF